MKNNNVMDRLRAARPAPPPSADDQDERFAEIIAEPGDPRLASSTASAMSGSARRWTTRPRILAVGSLGLAGIVAGLVLAFSGSTAPPAFAVIQNSDGSLLVHLYHMGRVDSPGTRAADQELNAAGIPGTLYYGVWHGPAPVPGPIRCTGQVFNKTGVSVSGPAPEPGQQQVEMLLGSDGTEVTPAGQPFAGSAWHLVMCMVIPPDSGGSSTDTDTGPAVTTGSPPVTTGDTITNGAG